MARFLTVNKVGSLAGTFLVCLSGLGLVTPTSPARADDAASTQATPIGVDDQGNQLDLSPDPDATATLESGATEGFVASHSPDGDTDEKIIGGDDRRRITNTTEFPNSAVVYIHRSNGRQYCTGWLVSPDTLVTAGHCIYDDNGWNFNLEYSPGANGSERPYGTATAAQLWTDTTWVSDRDSRQDWGIVKLDRAFPDAGYFGLRWQTASYDGTEVQLRGCPQDRPAGELWGMGGPITESQPNNLRYQMDTYNAQSGSPVFLGDVHQSIAIHTGSVGSEEQNRSTRITEGLCNIILDLRS
ncbi:MAG: trypsin-like serine protease [Propionibacteriaceae bacterium]|nr:trypsin-like serine protease [Propionibacteriaceae bacterium]